MMTKTWVTKLNLSFMGMMSLFLLAWPAQAEDNHHHHHEESELKLTLNDGQKWFADQHTADSAAEMQAALATFKKEYPAPTVEDYQAFGEDLQGSLQSLIEGCTMEGADHDQLHVWILLFVPALQDLIHADGVKAGQATVETISHLFNAFDEYFQLDPSLE